MNPNNADISEGVRRALRCVVIMDDGIMLHPNWRENFLLVLPANEREQVFQILTNQAAMHWAEGDPAVKQATVTQQSKIFQKMFDAMNKGQ